jgi:hypothetical protein
MSKPRDRQDLYETAIHEAGHAAVSVATRAVFTRISVRRRGTADGYVSWYAYSARRRLLTDMPRHTAGKRIVREALIYGAGMASEMIYAKSIGQERNQEDLFARCTDDTVMVSRAIDFLVQYGFVEDSEDAREQTAGVIARQNFDILMARWPGVIALADALMETTTIGYRRARRIILEGHA